MQLSDKYKKHLKKGNSYIDELRRRVPKEIFQLYLEAEKEFAQAEEEYLRLYHNRVFAEAYSHSCQNVMS